MGYFCAGVAVGFLVGRAFPRRMDLTPFNKEIVRLRSENARLQNAIDLQHETPWWDENATLKEQHARDTAEIARANATIKDLLIVLDSD